MHQTDLMKDKPYVSDKESPLVLRFDQLGIQDVGLIGQRNASLGEIDHRFKNNGGISASGFVVTVHGYQYFFEHTGLKSKLHDLLTGFDKKDRRLRQQRSELAVKLILQNPLPEKLKSEISSAYDQLCREEYGDASNKIAEQIPRTEDNPAKFIMNSSLIAKQAIHGNIIEDWQDKLLNEPYSIVENLEGIINACHLSFTILFREKAILELDEPEAESADFSLAISIQKPTIPMNIDGLLNYNYQLSSKSNILVRGHAIGERIASGKVHIISNHKELKYFRPGEILVAQKTDPDWRPYMRKASAIVTNQGGRTCHSATSAREMLIPAIVGCRTATNDLKTGQTVTVCCAEGEEGNVYQDKLAFSHDNFEEFSKSHQTRTKIFINVGSPEEILGLAPLPCDGIGVARTEYIVADQVKIHPMALIHFDKLKDEKVKAKISELTEGFQNKPQFFIDKMVQGIGTIAASFFPRPVIVRMSDFKSNEYANLIGGKQFEPEEANPMIGWRGASRYYHPEYREGYHLECQAIKEVRDKLKLTNVIPLIPFCRTPEEADKVLAEMEGQGLKRGDNGLQIYVMCELPSNVILAAEFCQRFDGFSIGSNDLTQLILGIDRDSEQVDHLFDERNKAVKVMLEQIITTAKRHNCKVSICGQAPSDYPEFIPFLVDLGIDSISLSPDSVIKTRLAVFEAENPDLLDE